MCFFYLLLYRSIAFPFHLRRRQLIGPGTAERNGRTKRTTREQKGTEQHIQAKQKSNSRATLSHVDTSGVVVQCTDEDDGVLPHAMGPGNSFRQALVYGRIKRSLLFLTMSHCIRFQSVSFVMAGRNPRADHGGSGHPGGQPRVGYCSAFMRRAQ